MFFDLLVVFHYFVARGEPPGLISKQPLVRYSGGTPFVYRPSTLYHGIR
jgi:hypothetical protein